ncbi:hypothetical protein GOBAR_DD33830 [Gossypium barbadense]|nr:hypothetical protein GOBAR_DD33830 [Gossypium barbadense]
MNPLELEVAFLKNMVLVMEQDSHPEAIRVTLPKALSLVFLGEIWPNNRLRLWYGLFNFPTIHSYEGFPSVPCDQKRLFKSSHGILKVYLNRLWRKKDVMLTEHGFVIGS